MLNVPATLRFMADELTAQKLNFSRITLDAMASQVERALLEIDTARDFLAHRSLAKEALDRARVRLVGTAAIIHWDRADNEAGNAEPPLRLNHE